MMSDWYLVYTKARQEDVAAAGLEEQGYRVYLPKLKMKRRRSQGIVEVIQPLFPRYLFFAVRDKDQSIAPARYTAGVSKLVRFGIDYVPVPRGMIEALMMRENPETGYHTLIAPSLKQGDRVSIRTGPLAGFEGFFEAKSNQDRIIILLEMLGHHVRTEVSFGELEP